MMLSLLWYYRPEHLDRPNPEDLPDEVYASRHRDTTSVACIEDRCYVMTFNEYCRFVQTSHLQFKFYMRYKCGNSSVLDYVNCILKLFIRVCYSIILAT